MSDHPEQRSLSEECDDLTTTMAELVRRSLLQLGDMEAIRERLAQIGERLRRCEPASDTAE